MKGKHATAAANRRLRDLETQVARLTVDLEESRSAARTHANAAERLPRVESALRRAVEERETNTAPEIRRLEKVVGQLRKELDDALFAYGVAQDCYDRLRDYFKNQGFSVSEQLEALMAGLEGKNVTVSEGVFTSGKRLTAAQVRTIQRKRGLRGSRDLALTADKGVSKVVSRDRNFAADTVDAPDAEQVDA